MSELLLKHPQSAEVLFKNGLFCIGCPGASMENLEQGCLAHGIDPDKIVDELNKHFPNKNNPNKKYKRKKTNK